MSWLALYLKRLSLPAWPQLDQAGLAFLLRRHVESIAFGNVDVLLGAVPDLNHAALVEKLLVQGRPGYCYEVNTLLSSLLSSLGLTPQQHMARVLLDHGLVHERARSHLILTVQCNQQTWLLDAAFGGGGICEPIPLQADVVFDQGIDRYRLSAEQTPQCWYLQREIDGLWSNLYWFDQTPAYAADAKVGNHYAATAVDSIFVRDLIVTRMAGDQRLVLHNGRLNIRKLSASHSEPVLNEAGLQTTLAHYFNLSITTGQAKKLFTMTSPPDVHHHVLQADLPEPAQQ